MSIYVITGGTTGIGAATREKLQEQGHEVFNIDYKGGDYTADLSTKEGRKGAIEAVYQRYPDGIDCFISNAGVGPTVPAATLFSLNYFAATELAGRITAFIEKETRQLCYDSFQLHHLSVCPSRLGGHADQYS